MKKKDKKKLTVYPHPRALDVLGASATNLNLALEVFSELIIEATVKNAKTFNAGEWKFLIDNNNGTWFDPAIPARESLLIQAEDAMALEALDKKWKVDGAALVKKLKALTQIEAWAVIWVIRYFWDNHDLIDMQKEAFIPTIGFLSRFGSNDI